MWTCRVSHHVHRNENITHKRHDLKLIPGQISWRFDYPYWFSISIRWDNCYVGLKNQLLRFLCINISHINENRPKSNASDIAADNMSVGSRFRDRTTTWAFSTSKIGLDDIFMMCYNSNWQSYGLTVKLMVVKVPICELCVGWKKTACTFLTWNSLH